MIGRAVVAICALGVASCNLIFETPDYIYRAPVIAGQGGDSGAGSGTAGNGGDASAGTGGDGGALGCTPGDLRTCYTGPDGTLDVGRCQAGDQGCQTDGTWGPCMFEILPSTDVCGNLVDEDCDGDDSSCPLVNTGLVARWYIDEAASGTAAQEVLDASQFGLNVPITYVAGMPTFVEQDGERGLLWNASELDGGPTVSLLGTKLGEIGLTGIGTFELVIDMRNTPAEGTPLIFIGAGAGFGALSVTITNDEVQFYGNTSVLGSSWSFGSMLGRTVLHLRFDISGTTDDVALFVNGEARLSAQAGNIDPQNWGNFVLGLGNNPFAPRSMQGTLFYAAVYEDMLSFGDITANAAALAVHDDP